jgi:hypothetical protein
MERTVLCSSNIAFQLRDIRLLWVFEARCCRRWSYDTSAVKVYRLCDTGNLFIFMPLICWPLADLCYYYYHCYHLYIWCWNLDASGSRSETPGMFWNVVLEKISWTDNVRNEEVLLRVKEQRNILHEISKRKANWSGHILLRNCRLWQVIEGKRKGGIEVTGRRGRRRRKLLDDLKERWGYWHLKEQALDRTVCRAGFGRDFGPVVRQTAKWMNEWMSEWMNEWMTCNLF